MTIMFQNLGPVRKRGGRGACASYSRFWQDQKYNLFLQKGFSVHFAPQIFGPSTSIAIFFASALILVLLDLVSNFFCQHVQRLVPYSFLAVRCWGVIKQCLITFFPTLKLVFFDLHREKIDLEIKKLLKLEAEGQDFAKSLRLLGKFIRTVKGQYNFWNRIFLEVSQI